MKKLLTMGFIGLVLGAGAAFTTVTVGVKDAAAMTCCSTCEEGILECQNVCTNTTTCPMRCNKEWSWCTVECSPSC